MLRRFAIAAGVIASATVTVVLVLHFYRVSLCNRILERIDSLAQFPPAQTNDLEWAVHVYWTHNLHCNSLALTQASTASLLQVDTELSDALELGPSSSTINSLWERYGEMTSSGATYRHRYETEKDQIANAVSEQGLDYPYIDDYRHFSTAHKTD